MVLKTNRITSIVRISQKIRPICAARENKKNLVQSMYKFYAEQISYSNYISVNMKFLKHFETQKYVPRCMTVCFHQK